MDCETDVGVFFRFASFHLVLIAGKLSNIPLQSNGIDCGVWVIAAATARMRGYRTLSMKEANIPTFRRYLLDVVEKMEVAL